MGLWSDGEAVHLALADETPTEIVVATLSCAGGVFPSVARLHPPAIRLERAIFDLHGLRAEGAPDTRPWLDHGRWGIRHPLGAEQAMTASETEGGSFPDESTG